MSDPIKKKRRPPKYLEKMLLVNHKEDQLLQERLDDIHIRSRTREMQLERERIKVRDEWKESRRRQIPVDSIPPLVSPQNLPASRLPQRKIGTVEKPKLHRGTSLPEGKDSDNVNSYLLGEYRRMSEVIPSILLAISKKDEKKAKMPSLFPLQRIDEKEHRNEEPDLHRITKLARSVKKIRENMSFQKKIDLNRPRLSLSKMFKEMHERRYETDQHTDGTCALLKRKLEKRRRESMPELDMTTLPMRRTSDPKEPSAFHKSQSAPLLGVSDQSTDPTIYEEAEEEDVFETDFEVKLPSRFERSQSLQFNPSIQRHHTNLEKRESVSLNSRSHMQKRHSVSSGIARPSGQQPPPRKRHSIATVPRPSSLQLPKFNPRQTGSLVGAPHRRFDSHANAEFIDEDELRAKQRVAIELQKFERIRQKVDRFMSPENLGLKRGYTLFT